MKSIAKLIPFAILSIVLLNFIFVTSSHKLDVEEDDFSEFDDDDFEEDLPKGKGVKENNKQQQQQQQPKEKEKPTPAPNKKEDFDELDIEQEEDDQDQDIRDIPEIHEADEDNDEVMVEDDEFEGIDEDEFDEESTEGKRREPPPPKLTITPVAMPIRGWQAYWAELIMLTGIVVYLTNYMLGRYKNQRISQVFFEINWSLLEENFAFIGDSAKLEDDMGNRSLTKQSDSTYNLWCSGRQCCEGMLVELKLLKRQDIISLLSNIFRPTKDILRLSVEMGKDDMDSVVFLLANKKVALKTAKELNDLVNYCTDKKVGEKFGVPPYFYIFSELSEVCSWFFDTRTVSIINKYGTQIESIHLTDQFTGLKSLEPEVNKDGVLKFPEAKRFLFFTFLLNTTSTGGNVEDAMEEVKPLIQFVLNTVDRIKKFKLSREGKTKTDKNRQKVEELFMKQTHQARAEAAAAKREEKRRQEKEKILQEEDPEKQRRWEEKEMKREKKKKQPKMKQLKVKAL